MAETKWDRMAEIGPRIYLEQDVLVISALGPIET